LADIKRSLPREIVSELIQDERLVYLTVESCKKDVVRYLDTHLNIGADKDFIRTTFLEASHQEIDNYDFFRITPNALEGGRYVFCNVTRPTCPSESCPVGAQLVGPVRMKMKTAKRIGIAELGRPWATHPELLISAGLRRLFEEGGMNGLCDYEPCP